MDNPDTMTIHTHPALSLTSALRELAAFIERMSDDEYILIRQDLFTSSIGGQTRHALDHARILLQGTQTGLMDYDNRERGTDIEVSRTAALSQIKDLEKDLLLVKPEDMNQEVNIKVYLHSEHDPVLLKSTVGREVGFVLSHTIHHNALVAAMLRDLGISVSASFGYAPSTLAFQKSI